MQPLSEGHLDVHCGLKTTKGAWLADKKGGRAAGCETRHTRQARLREAGFPLRGCEEFRMAKKCASLVPVAGQLRPGAGLKQSMPSWKDVDCIDLRERSNNSPGIKTRIFRPGRGVKQPAMASGVANSYFHQRSHSQSEDHTTKMPQTSKKNCGCRPTGQNLSAKLTPVS